MDQKIHFYDSEDAKTLQKHSLSPAVHPVVLQESLEQARRDIVVQHMREIILREKNGEAILTAIIGNGHHKGPDRIFASFDILQVNMGKASIGSTKLNVEINGTVRELDFRGLNVLPFIVKPTGDDAASLTSQVQRALIEEGILIGEFSPGSEIPRVTTNISSDYIRGGVSRILGIRDLQYPVAKTIEIITDRTCLALEKKPPSDEDWANALLACPDEEFLRNFYFYCFGSTDQPESGFKRKLYPLGPAVLLRYHELNTASYRGLSRGGKYWLSPKDIPLCMVCDKGIPGSQNFIRNSGNQLHVSCVPKLLNKIKPDNRNEHENYMARVCEAMFPGVEIYKKRKPKKPERPNPRHAKRK